MKRELERERRIYYVPWTIHRQLDQYQEGDQVEGGTQEGLLVEDIPIN